MKTKEAVEFLEGQRNKPGDLVKPYRLGINSTLDGIIKLLQCGEEYEALAGDIERVVNLNMHHEDRLDVILDFIRNVKQKYLPTPIKKTIMIELTSESGDLIDRTIELLKNKEMEKWYNEKVKINIKECENV